MKTKDLFKGIATKYLLKYLIIGVLLMCALFFLLRSCSVTDRYSRLVGEYEALTKVQEEAESTAQINIENALENIDNLTNRNKGLTRRIELAEMEIVETDGDVARLESELIDAQDTGDKDAQISNLTEQVNTWKKRFTLARDIITDKDKIIFNLNEKYESQLRISVDFEKLYIAEKDLRQRGNVLLDISSRKLRTAKTGGTFKTMVISVLGGYVAYKLIKD